MIVKTRDLCFGILILIHNDALLERAGVIEEFVYVILLLITISPRLNHLLLLILVLDLRERVINLWWIDLILTFVPFGPLHQPKRYQKLLQFLIRPKQSKMLNLTVRIGIQL